MRSLPSHKPESSSRRSTDGAASRASTSANPIENIEGCALTDRHQQGKDTGKESKKMKSRRRKGSNSRDIFTAKGNDVLSEWGSNQEQPSDLDHLAIELNAGQYSGNLSGQMLFDETLLAFENLNLDSQPVAGCFNTPATPLPMVLNAVPSQHQHSTWALDLMSETETANLNPLPQVQNLALSSTYQSPHLSSTTNLLDPDQFTARAHGPVTESEIINPNHFPEMQSLAPRGTYNILPTPSFP
ncbi:hypothetical protein BJX99DRAFT_204453 [Aspergillus californicus]